MASSQAVGISCIMFMIIGMVNGRWLEVDTFSTSMVSDGVSDLAYHNTPNLVMAISNSSESTTTLYAEKRCHSIYGFLPCADTIQEGIFLMVMYTYLMMLGEEWIHKGSHALFMFLGDQAFGASVFRVFMALPRIVIVIVSGVLATASDAQNQVAFGVSMYAGSTVITLTIIWGLRIILSRDKLRGKGSTEEYEHKDYSYVGRKLSFLSDTGVNIDKETGKISLMMLLSLIPFGTVALVEFIEISGTILIALTVSVVSLLLCFAYQMWTPWIQARSLAYLKQENLQSRLFYHVQKFAEVDLIDAQGNPNFTALKSFFNKADKDGDGYISHDELEKLIQNDFELQKDEISTEYAKAEILTHFHDGGRGKVDWSEFKKGCTKWLQKWKKVPYNSDSESTNFWKKVEKIAIEEKHANLTKIENLMPKILRQVFEKHDLLTNGKADKGKIEGLFCKFDKDGTQKLDRNEFEKFIESIHFGVSLDHDTVLNKVVNELDINNTNNLIEKEEFVDGFVNWVNKAMDHSPNIKGTRDAIAKLEADTWGEIYVPVKMDQPKARIIYVVLGVGIIYLISGAFMQSVIQFSNAAHIPFVFTSFVMAPISMNAKIIIMALLSAGSHVSKNASLAFSEIYSGLVMNNLLGLSTLIATVYIKGLPWSYSAEVVTIMIPCIIVGVFALNRDTYPLWTSICAILLYPVFIYLFCFGFLKICVIGC